MKMKRILFCVILLCAVLPFSFSDDGEAALKYAEWMRQAVNENRLEDALALIPRIGGFTDFSSDLSYLIADVYSKTLRDRSVIIAFLDIAIEVNRWVYYSENEALLFKAEELINMRRYSSALAALDQITAAGALGLSNDAAFLRLKAYRGIANNSSGATEIAVFQTFALSVMNRFSRDPRAAIIFLEYLKVKLEIDIMDQQLLDTVIRRLPSLVELAPDLALMAAPFMQNEADAKRYIASYRSGTFLQNAENFYSSQMSIPLALNHGLISDSQAVEELFFTPAIGTAHRTGEATIDLNVLNDTYRYLRSEEGRMFFTRSLLNFTGSIISDDDHDGIIDTRVYYDQGIVKNLRRDSNQDNIFDTHISFDSNGLPIEAMIPVLGMEQNALVYWERYPSARLISLSQEAFNFRLMDFNYSPVSYIVLGGARNLAGVSYPVLSRDNFLNRRMLVSFCSHIDRFSSEFDQAIERIYLEDGIPLKAEEFLNDTIISITEFESGLPVVQYVDLDLDGRMETIRRFHRPGQEFIWPDFEERFDYRKLIASSESDWTGEGKFKTGEVYLNDGSVVYMFDIDGLGSMHSIEFD